MLINIFVSFLLLTLLPVTNASGSYENLANTGYDSDDDIFVISRATIETPEEIRSREQKKQLIDRLESAIQTNNLESFNALKSQLSRLDPDEYYSLIDNAILYGSLNIFSQLFTTMPTVGELAYKRDRFLSNSINSLSKPTDKAYYDSDDETSAELAAKRLVDDKRLLDDKYNIFELLLKHYSSNPNAMSDALYKAIDWNRKDIAARLLSRRTIPPESCAQILNWYVSSSASHRAESEQGDLLHQFLAHDMGELIFPALETLIRDNRLDVLQKIINHVRASGQTQTLQEIEGKVLSLAAEYRKHDLLQALLPSATDETKKRKALLRFVETESSIRNAQNGQTYSYHSCARVSRSDFESNDRILMALLQAGQSQATMNEAFRIAIRENNMNTARILLHGNPSARFEEGDFERALELAVQLRSEENIRFLLHMAGVDDEREYLRRPPIAGAPSEEQLLIILQRLVETHHRERGRYFDIVFDRINVIISKQPAERLRQGNAQYRQLANLPIRQYRQLANLPIRRNNQQTDFNLCEIHQYARKVDQPLKEFLEEKVGSTPTRTQEFLLNELARLIDSNYSIQEIREIESKLNQIQAELQNQLTDETIRRHMTLALAYLDSLGNQKATAASSSSRRTSHEDRHGPHRIWLNGFLNESATAYSGSGHGEKISCEGGINERVRTGLRGVSSEIDKIFAPAEGHLLIRKAINNLDLTNPRLVLLIATDLINRGITEASSEQDVKEAYRNYLTEIIESNNGTVASYGGEIANILAVFSESYEGRIQPKIAELIRLFENRKIKEEQDQAYREEFENGLMDAEDTRLRQAGSVERPVKRSVTQATTVSTPPLAVSAATVQAQSRGLSLGGQSSSQMTREELRRARLNALGPSS